MKAIKHLLGRFDRELTKYEVEEELGFHLERLTQENIKATTSWDEARETAQRRFGNVERIRDQCVEIKRRSNPFRRALKSFLILVFIAGVLVRVFSPEYHVARVGDILMAVAFLGRLLLYLRGLNPSVLPERREDSTSLKLNLNSQTPFPVYDENRLTPVERIILDK